MKSGSSPVVVVDNGAHTIKAGLSTSPASSLRKIYNAAIRSKGDKRLYIGHEFERCKDYASLNYRLAFERGYLMDWDVQKAVWDGLFGPEVFSLDFRSTSILITEPPFNLHSIQEKYDQLIFEEYEFASYARSPVASLLPYGHLFSNPASPSNRSYPECFLIVDSGFSFTHIVPVMLGEILWNGVRRIDVGGKLLTNHLSTLVSFRQWNMLDQTHIVNDFKEKCCFVSSTFARDLERCRKESGAITLEYVLPDFSRNRHGFVRRKPTSYPHTHAKIGEPLVSDNATDVVGEDSMNQVSYVDNQHAANEGHDLSGSDQILYMSNERFSVPELLFKPSNIGLQQSGLPETIAHSIASLPSELQGMFWANIGLIGGNVKFPGFGDRLRQDLQSLAPVEYAVGVYEADDPITEAYKSAHAFANSEAFQTLAVTRAEYSEGGSNACRRKFRKFDWDPIRDRADDDARAAARRDRDKGKSKAVEDSDGEQSEDERRKKPARRAANRKVEKAPARRLRPEASRGDAR